MRAFLLSARIPFAPAHLVHCGTVGNALARIAGMVTWTSPGSRGFDENGLTLFKRVLGSSSTPQTR